MLGEEQQPVAGAPAGRSSVGEQVGDTQSHRGDDGVARASRVALQEAAPVIALADGERRVLVVVGGAAGRRTRLREKGESPEDFRGRVLRALRDRIDRLDLQPALLADGHVFDALIAAYTAWLAPDGLEQPPEGFNLASGWIWFPRAGV